MEPIIKYSRSSVSIQGAVVLTVITTGIVVGLSNTPFALYPTLLIPLAFFTMRESVIIKPTEKKYTYGTTIFWLPPFYKWSALTDKCFLILAPSLKVTTHSTGRFEHEATTRWETSITLINPVSHEKITILKGDYAELKNKAEILAETLTIQLVDKTAKR